MGSEQLVHSTKRDDYCTPLSIIEQMKSAWGEIGFDPCASTNHDLHFARINTCQCDGCCGDGLNCLWLTNGLTFFNPPYGGRTGKINGWIDKAIREHERGAEIVCIVPASTGSQWFKGIWRTATAGCFVEGRLTFRDPDTGSPVLGLDKKTGKQHSQTATFWSFLGYWGDQQETFFDAFGGIGECARLNVPTTAPIVAPDSGVPGEEYGERQTGPSGHVGW